MRKAFRAHYTLDYNLLFRWFVGLAMDDDAVWVPTTFRRTATIC